MKNPPLNAGKKISTGPEKVYSLLVYQLIHKISNHTWMGSTKCPRKNKWHHPHSLIKNSFPGGTNRIPPLCIIRCFNRFEQAMQKSFCKFSIKKWEKEMQDSIKIRKNRWIGKSWGDWFGRENFNDSRCSGSDWLSVWDVRFKLRL